MSSISFSRQNLGIFQKDLPKIVNALVRVENQVRTHVGKYTVLDLKKDPPFPEGGAFKTAYYCVSIGLGSGEFTVYVALKSALHCPFFQKEKRVFSILNGAKGVLHPLLIQELGDFEYMISELFNQGDLFSFITNPARSLHTYEMDWIGYSIVCALFECHIRGIVLRDLKPENILVRQHEDGSFEINLIDFGFAFIMNEDDHAEAIRFSGSPLYTSTEDWEELRKTGARPPADYSRDLWPLGLILYALATRGLPVEEVDSGIKVLPEHTDSLGIFDGEIRDLIYKNQKNRPSLESIKERMGAILNRTYPHYVDGSIAPSQESFLIEIEDNAPQKPIHRSLLSRICCCFKNSKNK